MVHPLFTASLNGHLDVVRFLCEASADKDKAVQGWPPLIVASPWAEPDVFKC